jgi:hypothetical protein
VWKRDKQIRSLAVWRSPHLVISSILFPDT